MPHARKYTKELLEAAVPNCKSIRELARHLGSNDRDKKTRNLINYRILEYGINTEHFTRKGVSRVRRLAKYTPDVILVNDLGTHVSSNVIKRCLLETGRVYECSTCGISEWLGNPITLHIDHIDGVNTHNERDNLRFLCPNCHQQTDTWGRPNRKKVEAIEDNIQRV